jgi:hypothetical protein
MLFLRLFYLWFSRFYFWNAFENHCPLDYKFGNEQLSDSIVFDDWIVSADW